MNISQLLFNPVLPLWLLLPLVAAAGCGVIWAYQRCSAPSTIRRRLLAIRLTALALITFLLLLPSRRLTEQKLEAPTVAVACDISASMLNSPDTDPKIRQHRLKAFLAEKGLQQCLKKYRIAWYHFGARVENAEDPQTQPLTFTAPRTHIQHALNEIVRRSSGLNLAAIILLSDGLNQEEEPLTPAARRVPVLIPELEPPQIRKSVTPKKNDLFISDLSAPKMLVVFWKGTVNVVVERSSGTGKQVCPVRLYRGRESMGVAYATFDDGQVLCSLTFTIEPVEVGRMLYRVVVDAPSDPNQKNNKRSFMVEVTDPKNRVLYLEGTPRWEFKFLKRTILAERNYHLSAFVRAGNGQFINFSEENAAAVSPLPEVFSKRLLDYRVIILGEMPRATLSDAQQQALADYVDKGGGLLFLGGTRALGKNGWPGSPALGPLLPFENETNARMNDGHFVVEKSAQGSAHPVLAGLKDLTTFPPIISYWGPGKTRPAATVLLQTEEQRPVLAVMLHGEGKVAAFLSDSLWRWQLEGVRAGREKTLYAQVISQLLHWLAPEKKKVHTESDNLRLFTRSAQVEVRDRIILGVVSRAATPPHCVVLTPDKRRLPIRLTPALLGSDVGLNDPVRGWRGEFSPYLAGNYRFKARRGKKAKKDQTETQVLAIEPQVEKTEQPIDREYLRRLARSTGGAFFPEAEHKPLWQQIPYHPAQTRITRETSLWNHAWLLLLLIALFSLEWVLRIRHNLV